MVQIYQIIIIWKNFANSIFKSSTKKSDLRRSVTITLSIIPFQTIRKA